MQDGARFSSDDLVGWFIGVKYFTPVSRAANLVKSKTRTQMAKKQNFQPKKRIMQNKTYNLVQHLHSILFFDMLHDLCRSHNNGVWGN